jgi:hypothetical protein
MSLEEYLSRMRTGDIQCFNGGEQLCKVGYDTFTVLDRYGTISQGNSSWIINAIIGGGGNGGSKAIPLGTTSLGLPGLTSAGSGLASIQWPPGPGLTSEEIKELDQLEIEAKAFIKQSKLNKFKGFPSHLRQEVVDDAYIRDLIASLGNENEKNFPDAARLNHLRNKKQNYNYPGQVHISSSSYFHYDGLVNGSFVSKYEHILKHFTTEELAKAHAEACLEEDIST